ncbi:DUF3450 domain-containing protein [Ferrimonas lipolytica]|uniref:DUF3450 domain-containing protein n=1 Tax=Ferrimonas lipolytica TaxID=2724191 RepID=A0A6H1UCW8_9GAMM|nr:DUF3450 domain-containing protein [Ferrimonas lipolytica]QIZ76688.1 DUF3450 domain-containing protein [Ferrimonas lipolytica]
MRKLASTALLLACTQVQAAQPLDMAQQQQAQLQQAGRDTQQQVNQLAEQKLLEQADLERLQEDFDNLTVYHQHLSQLVADQERELTDLNTQLNGIEATRAGLVPLIYQMLDQLEQLLDNDIPVKEEQRRNRLADLKLMMGRADVADAEKFRRVLEAFQIEVDTGRRLGLYRGAVVVNDGSEREVELLHVGRLSLLARSLNGTLYWQWQTDHWQPVESNDISELVKAYEIAAGQRAPDLLTIPVTAKGAN